MSALCRYVGAKAAADALAVFGAGQFFGAEKIVNTELGQKFRIGCAREIQE